MVVYMFCDGASRGNPGVSGIGVSILKEGKEVAFISKSIGEKTNNEAEYTALLEGLKKVEQFREEVVICLDSQLVVKQIKGEYRVKAAKVKPLFTQVKQELENITLKDIMWIPREENKRADELANEAIDSTT